jgi:protein SCO1/2
MTQKKKIFGAVMWSLAILLGIFLVALHWISAKWKVAETESAGGVTVIDPSQNSPGPPEVLYNAPMFTLTDQTGSAFSSDRLRGHVWVADFFYTTCTGLCPMMSAHMESLQGQLPPQVLLVSFSVDPVHDTPPVLAAYADKFHATSGKWFFLTGDPKVQQQVVTGMKMFSGPASDGQAMQHDFRFVLVDDQLRVRGIYDSTSTDSMNKLVSDAQYLLQNVTVGAAR